MLILETIIIQQDGPNSCKCSPRILAEHSVNPDVADLCVQNEAVIYMEPEKRILSRSGDECVVALCDQW